MQTVYVVDPDEGIRDALKTFLESFDVPVQLYSNAYEFLDAVDASHRGCVLVEAELQGLNGLGLLSQLRKRGNDIPLFLLVDSGTREFTQLALDNGAKGVFEKPLVKDDLVAQLGLLSCAAWAGLRAACTSHKTLADGTQITIRPIQPGDREIERAFVHNLSPRSRYYRFFGALRDLSESMLDRFIHIHYPDNVAYIATVNGDDGDCEIAVARYLQTSDKHTEFAITVADAWQRKGVGTLLFKHLLNCAKNAGIQCIEGIVLRENRGMLMFACQFGFTVNAEPGEPGVLHITLQLDNTEPAPGS